MGVQHPCRSGRNRAGILYPPYRGSVHYDWKDGVHGLSSMGVVYQCARSAAGQKRRTAVTSLSGA